MFRKKQNPKPLEYDRVNTRPVLKCSICNGEQVAGFLDIHTGRFKEVLLVKSREDLKEFLDRYGIEEKEIKKVY